MNLNDASKLPVNELGCVPRFGSAEEAQAYLTQQGVKYVLAQFVDIHGVAKAKSVPVSHLKSVLTAGAGFAGFCDLGRRDRAERPRLYGGRRSGDAHAGAVAAGPGTDCLRRSCGWRSVAIRFARDLEETGRTDDRAQLDALHGSGAGILAAAAARRPARLSHAIRAIRSPSRATTTRDSRARGVFLEKLTESMRAVGIDVYQIDHEDANGQFEINYTYTDCLTSCDHYVFFKMAASEIANELDMICSFMPKPFANRPGNGMHMHMSIGDGERNLFSDKSDKLGMGLSTLGYQFTAGLLAHAPALAALCNPTVNSYKRLVVGRSLTGATWAPAYISYGDNNRSTMVRMPGERIELRLPDGACNPYLATSAVIAAGLGRHRPWSVTGRTG